MREPCFDNMLKVLKRQVPDRPVLYEFFLNVEICKKLSGMEPEEGKTLASDYKLVINAFKNGGYDYAPLRGSGFGFPTKAKNHDKSWSLNDGCIITDRESFEKYPWPDPDDFDYSRLEECRSELPKGMKLIVWGPSGVLENVTSLVGFDNLCFMIADDPELVQEIFDAVGCRLVRYYELCGKYDTVGAMMGNDDWGFNSGTMISPEHLRKYVFPWHKKIVEVIHAAGKPAILHSCGKLTDVFDDIIDDIKYDAKHSYEDKIVPVEEAYERWGSRIAIFGGIDMDFICRATPEEIRKRCSEMLERTKDRGGYALGSGNSIADYVPMENYLAMISVVNKE